MLYSLEKLTQKYVLLNAKLKLKYSSETISFSSGFFESGTAKDADKLEKKYMAKRANLIYKIKKLKEKIILMMRKSYNYETLNKDEQEKIDVIIDEYLEKMNEQVKEMLVNLQKGTFKKL